VEATRIEEKLAAENNFITQTILSHQYFSRSVLADGYELTFKSYNFRKYFSVSYKVEEDSLERYKKW
jgi:hypothetical protein